MRRIAVSETESGLATWLNTLNLLDYSIRVSSVQIGLCLGVVHANY